MHAVLRRQRVFGHIPLYSSTAHYISFYFALPDVVWLDDVIHTASNAAGGILMMDLQRQADFHVAHYLVIERSCLAIPFGYANQSTQRKA